MNNMQFYVLSGLLRPEYKTRICLAGPFFSVEEALNSAKNQNWKNWIIEGHNDLLVIGQKIDLPFAFDVKDIAHHNYRVVTE